MPSLRAAARMPVITVKVHSRPVSSMRDVPLSWVIVLESRADQGLTRSPCLRKEKAVGGKTIYVCSSDMDEVIPEVNVVSNSHYPSSTP